MADEQAVKQVYELAYESNGFIFTPSFYGRDVPNEYLGESWADVRSKLPEGATTQPTPASELELECFGFIRSMDHHYGEEFVPPDSCAETALNNIRRIIKMPPVPSAGSKPQEEGGCPKCHKPMLGEGWNPETGVRYFSHVNSEDAAVCDEDIEIPGPSQPVADGGGLQEWEALKAAAEKVLPGTREIRSNSAEVSLIAPAGTFNGWQRPNRTICRMHASIGSTQTRQEKIIEFEFLSQASPENILKLLAELASSQEALIALRERMQQAVEKLKPWLRTDCGCAVTEAIKGSSR